MDITLDISRLQADYDTAMRWAETLEEDKEKQANYYMAAALAQEKLSKLVPDQAMKARHIKERDRLMQIAAPIKKFELPVSQSNAQKTVNVLNKAEIATAVLPHAAKPEQKSMLKKDSDADDLNLDMESFRFTDPSVLKMSFKELGGREAEIEKVLSFFKHRVEKSEYQKLDQAAKDIKSIEPKLNMFIYGPPGTGKSAFLSAVGRHVLETQENSVFYMLTPDVFRSKYRGVSEQIINRVFSDSQHYQTALICIDEISSLCPRNKENLHEADRGTLNTFLNLVDGVKKNEGHDVIVIAATNYPWDIDEAALSRMPEQMYFGLPNREARKQFFLGHAKSYLADDTDEQERIATYLADRTENASYRDMNQIAGRLYALCWRKTLEANPENKEVDTFIPATSDELERIIGEINIRENKNENYRLEHPELWDEIEFNKYLRRGV